jgi:endonuclease-3
MEEGYVTEADDKQHESVPSISDVHRGIKTALEPQETPPVEGAFEWVLWELVAYLADDNKRLAAFTKLKETVGTSPEQLLAAPAGVLCGIGSAGIMPEQTAGKLRSAAEIAISEFGGDADSILKKPLPEARKALQRFPSIGAPGADKILLFTCAYPVFALDSNGLRVLNRLGYGSESADYNRNYKSVMSEIESDLPKDFDSLIELYLLLRTHGQKICRRSNPQCSECPLRLNCLHFASAVSI